VLGVDSLTNFTGRLPWNLGTSASWNLQGLSALYLPFYHKLKKCVQDIYRPNILFLYIAGGEKENNRLPVDTASFPKRLESSSAMLWNPQNTQTGC
jgi:hypothetical protein